jgi:hypothetical protein
MKLTNLSNALVNIMTARSSDGGNTWTQVQSMPSPNSGWTNADPTMIRRSNGNIGLAYIHFKTSLDSGKIYYRETTDAGLTWSNPVEAFDVSETSDIGIDRPWLATDRSGGSFDGRIYMVTKSHKDAPVPKRLHIKHSDDGINWQGPRRLDSLINVGIPASMGTPAVGADGAFYTAYLSYDPPNNLFIRFIILKSTDGGLNFSPYVMEILPLSSASQPADSLYQYSYSLVAHPNDPAKLFFAYTDRRNGDLDILGMYSHDGGQTWQSCGRINDDGLTNGIGQDMCWAYWSEDGTLSVAWRDRRQSGSGGSSPYRIAAAVSYNNGVSFSVNQFISQSQGNLMIPIDGNDFLGLSANGNTVRSTWTDKRTNINQIYYNRTYFPPAITSSETKPEDNTLVSNGAGAWQISRKTGDSYQWQLYSITGSLLREGRGAGSLSLENLDLSEGQYLLRMISSEKITNFNLRK